MAIDAGTAFVDIKPDFHGLQRSLQSTGAGIFGGWGNKMGLLAGAGIAAGIGAAVGGVKLAFDIGSSFDTAFDTIRTETGKTGQALEALKDDFRGVVGDSPASFEDASAAIAGLNQRLGLTGKPLQDLAIQMTDLSRITGGDLNANLDTATRLLGDWSIPAEMAAGALDKVFRASQATGTGFDQLSALATQFGGPMRQLGFSFDETLALIGKFNKEGVNTELVMGAMRIALGKMARQGEAPVETFRRVAGEIKNAGDAGEANAKALELFGARAGPDMAAAIREGRFEIDELLGTISGGENTIRGAADETADFGEKWQEIKNRVFLALEPVVVRVFDAIGTAMDKLGPLMGRLAVGFRALGAAFSGEGITSNGFVGVMERIGVAGRAVVDWFKANWPAIRDTVVTVSQGVLAAVGAVVDWFRAHWPEIKAIVTETIQTVTAVIQGGVDFIRTIWENFGSQITQATEGAWRTISGIVDGVLSVIRGIVQVFSGLLHGDFSMVWEGIKGIFSGAWQAIAGIVMGGLDILKGVVSTAMEIVRSTFSGAWEGIKSAASTGLNEVVGFFTALPGRITGALAGLAGQLFNLGKNILGFGGFIGGIDIEFFGSVVTWLKDLGNKIIRFIGNVSRLLWDIGKQIIGGLIGGINEAAEGALKGALGSLAGKIADWKGPIEEDRKVLIPHGRAFMDGLIQGIQSKEPDLKSVLNRFATSAGSWVKGVVGGDGWDVPAADGSIGSGTAGVRSYLNKAGVPFRVSSAFRPGSKGWHGVPGPGGAMATDLVGPNMMAIAQAFAPVAGQLRELIFTPLGRSVKNGRWVAPYAQADHYDHVHVATYHGGGIADSEAFLPLIRRDEMMLDPDLSRFVQDAAASAGGSQSVTVEIPVFLNGREIARATAPDMAKELRNVQRAYQ